MPDLPPSLPDLPAEILVQIAEYTDEITIWRLRAVCRHVRAAVKVTLRPFLVEKRVILDPPLFHDIYTPIDPIHATEDALLVRALDLTSLSDRFGRHIAASAQTENLIRMRKLVLEVRDEDTASNWPYLQLFAEQLEELEIHIFDRLWPAGEKDGYGDPRRKAARAGAVLPIDTWSRVLYPPDVQFTKLITLTLCATARVLDHFAGIAPCLPELQHLSLSCHGQLGSDSYEGPASPFNVEARNLPTLERLTIAGEDSLISKILRLLIFSAPNIRFLTLHTTLSTYRPYRPVSKTIISIVASCPTIVGLALYGESVTELLLMLESVVKGRLGHIRTLVLEEISGQNGDEYSLYPMLSEETKLEPDFPALQYLSWVNRRFLDSGSLPDYDPTGWYRPRSRSEHRSESSGSEMWKLFQRYPTLRKVQFLHDYPDDPFSNPDTLEEEAMFGSVERPHDDVSENDE